ncbi:MAG TPA: 23S rRNA (adenine(2503)-C(2))-methyltransferase RlmN [Halanaerobiales bacterium]|nr:23S rRNA (adenine(2503)-C(2))-methyltransferase RlmN [Halanaerobiales bacterium]
MKKQDLKALSRSELINWFKENGYQAYRAEQVFNWLYKNDIDNFEKMTNLPKKMKDDLKTISYFTKLKLIDKKEENDGTNKYLWGLSDNEKIESVFLPFDNKRNSVCVSSQVGCSLNCLFCATGKSGLIRDLTTAEIIDQVFQIQNDIREEYIKPRISNIDFMGMGEPLNNFDAVLKAIEILNDEAGFNIGSRKITISTSGIIPGIIRLAEMHSQLVLAVSLNAPDEKLRNKLMPINRKYPLRELLSAVKYYINKTGRRVTFEYVLIDDLNNSINQARKTAEIIKDIHCHINLIPFNPVKDSDFEKPLKKQTVEFKKVLETSGIETTIRKERGTGIEAACGQLRH